MTGLDTVWPQRHQKGQRRCLEVGAPRSCDSPILHVLDDARRLMLVGPCLCLAPRKPCVLGYAHRSLTMPTPPYPLHHVYVDGLAAGVCPLDSHRSSSGSRRLTSWDDAPLPRGLLGPSRSSCDDLLDHVAIGYCLARSGTFLQHACRVGSDEFLDVWRN